MYNNWLPNFPTQSDEKIYVQGEDAARAYLVTANGFVRLWDSTQNVFYEKRADSSGRPYMDKFSYEKITEEQPTDDSFKLLDERLKKIERMLSNESDESNADDE